MVAKKRDRDPQRYATNQQRWEILTRDSFKCRYCGIALSNQTAVMDHVIPWIRGGRTSVDNLVAACPDCNKLKCNRISVKPAPLGTQDYPTDKLRNIKPKKGRVKYKSPVTPERKSPCKHKASPNCRRQRCLEERRITFKGKPQTL